MREHGLATEFVYEKIVSYRRRDLGAIPKLHLRAYETRNEEQVVC